MKIRKLLLSLFAIVVVGSLAYAQGQATSAMGGMQMPSPAEIKRQMEAMKPEMVKEAKQEIKAWDKNQDGELNEDEFKEMINSEAKEMADMMAQFSGMPGAPAPELPDIFQKAVDVADDAENETKVAEFDKAITAVFDEYDEDDNDMLSAEEFTEYGFDQTLAMMGMDDDSDDDSAEAEDADSEE